MRYQDRIYIQNQNQNLRNKDILNVSTSSDFCVFDSPTYNMSGGTKILCDEVTCEFSGITMQNFLSAATANCSGATDECLTSIQWSTKIYEDNEFTYSADFLTTYQLTGDTLTNSAFVNQINTGLNTLGYTYTKTGDRFDIEKKFGVSDLQIDICVNFDLSSSNESCPVGYSGTPAGDGCQSFTYTAATTGSTVTAIAGDTFSGFDIKGASFHPNVDTFAWPVMFSGNTGVVGAYSGTNFMVDSNNVLVPASAGGPGLTYYDKPAVQNALWGNGSVANGRMNNVGIQSSPSTTNEWLGFAYCVDIAESGTYYLGMGADDSFRTSIDGEQLFDQVVTSGPLYAPYNIGTSLQIQHFWVFEINLTSGKHVFEMEYYDSGGLASMTMELYSGTSIAALSAMTTESELSGVTIFTTGDQIGETFSIGDTVGFGCPSGYVYDVCYTADTRCIQINNADFSGCTFTGTCSEYCESACTETFLGIDATSTGVHVISTATTIDITFDFTGNTDSFIDTNATFKYDIYKYNHLSGTFAKPSVFSSDEIAYSSFSGTSALTQTIPTGTLGLDGEFLVKGYYVHDVCTDFLSRLGERHDTSLFKTGDKFDLYDANKDYYFVAMTTAEEPVFQPTGVILGTPKLYQQVIIPSVSGQTLFSLDNIVEGEVFVSLNGSILAYQYDWDYASTGLIQMSGFTVPTDIVTVTYTTSVSNPLTTEVIDIVTAIVSGTTDNEGTNNPYFNTTEGKYEVYTETSMYAGSQVILSLNGTQLASGVDFYQSTSNDKRLILEGNLLVNDIITIQYVGTASPINGITTNEPLISWSIPTAPANTDGRFVLEVGTTNTFTNIVSTAETQYITNVNQYSDTVTVSGSVGTELFYRVTNEKDYISIKGDKIESSAVSETVPITITVNSINSY